MPKGYTYFLSKSVESLNQTIKLRILHDEVINKREGSLEIAEHSPITIEKF